ncbi:MAG: hypothetical protein A3J66_03230 [Candidatus Magasanikbacteria bacterium RIFCSPHIGHO2_02_FULL_47_14]|uniref:Uncharacterized protein n=1 Tax=Candidatus Magasanikbacteria bacterium RIFCSPHIGHO2_02_FULL_47_14 TaxID=1798680 RepID=A0A1F6M8I4_9BACT|nr:MAG: hypothetical protein A3J66_03230 [Candidatus Magasanikbacteria bacterium RIFCSPHIGHO2_02_FULL_47_14]
MRDKVDDIVIQEPPIQELKKKKSCLKRTCVTGCGCIVIFFVVSLFLLRLLHGPKQQELKEVPEPVHELVQVYEPDYIQKITLTKAGDRGRVIETLALVPKTLLAPIIITAQKTQGDAGWWKEIKEFIETPVTQAQDSIKIEWENVPAQPTFVVQYYQAAFEKKNFKMKTPEILGGASQYTFVSVENDQSASLYIVDDLSAFGTTYISLELFSSSF